MTGFYSHILGRVAQCSVCVVVLPATTYTYSHTHTHTYTHDGQGCSPSIHTARMWSVTQQQIRLIIIPCIVSINVISKPLTRSCYCLNIVIGSRNIYIIQYIVPCTYKLVLKHFLSKFPRSSSIAIATNFRLTDSAF